MSTLKTRKTKAVEAIASALVEFVEANDAECEKRIQKAIGARFDKQDATLRMFWKQMGGNGRLPIDED